MAVASSPFGAASHPHGPSLPCAAVAAGEFEIIERKPPNSVTFYLRMRATGALFLVAPARCPEEPRLWSMWVHRCLPGSLVDITQPPWIDPERLRREDLAVAAQAIHDDVDGWLNRTGQEPLRRWMLDGVEQRR